MNRTLGLGGAVTVGLGAMVGAGVFAVWSPAAGAAGDAWLWALLVAGVVAWCNATSSAALAATHPSSGGTYVYGRERLGPFWGYLAGWAFVLGKTASCAAMAMVVGSYLLPGSERSVAALAVVTVTALNVLGVQRSLAATRVILTLVVLVLLAVVLAGWWPGTVGAQAGTDAVSTGGGAPGWPGLLEGAGLFFFAFAGYARITTLGEEVRDPARVIPRAVLLSLGVVLVLYLAVGGTVLGTLGPQGAAASGAPVVDTAVLVWGGQEWVWVVRVAAGLAALGALLNLVLGISRTVLAMARDGHLPSRLTALSARGQVPRAAEVAVGAVVLLVVLSVDLRGAIGFSSFGVLLYYAVANASALTLPAPARPSSAVPVLGLVGCLVLAFSLPLDSVLAGAVLVGLGLVAYPITRARRTRRARG
ncbi:APC family permease [Ornithinimicrobium sp. LYQ92]|uniref:APC family permease n=1 Tax=Serinicoccus sp. LYQ92 TaxID=3378798 RepID=UPI0038542614